MIGAHWPALLEASCAEPPDSVERWLERALAAACAVAWEWDVGTGESSLSASAMALLGLKDHPTNGSFALVHPADRDWLQQAIIEAACGELPYDFEFRLLRRDGEVEWVRDRGQLERDPAGRPRRLAGVAQLITDQKRTEAAYAATFEQAAVGMAHTALNGAFLKVNDTLCRITGRTREALLRLSFQEITHPDDLDAGVAQANDLLAGRIATFTREKRYIRPDREVVWIKLTASLVRDAVGRPDYFITVMDDIGERKRAEAAERRSDARFRALVKASSQAVWHASPWFPARDADGPVGGVNIVTHEVAKQRAAEEQERSLLQLIERCNDFIAITDADGRYTYINHSGRCMVGLDDDADLDNVRLGDFVAPASRDSVHMDWLSEARDRGVCKGEVQLVHPRTGAMIDVHRTVFALRDREGALTGYATVKRDITAAKAAAAALAESEARFRGTFEQAAVGFAHIGPDGSWLKVNRRLCDMLGYTETELLERTVQDLTYPDDLTATLDNINRLLEGEIATHTMETRYIRKDGSLLCGYLTASLLCDGAGAPKHFIAVVEDISHRMDLVATLRAFYEISPLLMGTLELTADGDLVRLHSNPAAIRFTGGADGIMGGLSARAAGVPEKVTALMRARAEEAIAHARPVAFECIYPTAAGPREIAATIVPLPTRGPAGGPTIFYVSQDITERHAAEARLAESEARLRLATEAGQVGVFDSDLRTNELRWDARHRAMWALPPGVPASVELFYAGLHPDDRERVVKTVAAALHPASGGFYKAEYRVIGLADGVERIIAARGRVSFEGEQAVRIVGTAVDVTAQRQAEATLARSNADLERLVEAHTRNLQQTHARLAQAEKLAALGQLAGGIAHDFNNVLQAIQGAAEMIRVRPHNQAVIQRSAEIIERVARRGSAVTNRMLTFARRGKRQTEPVDPAAALAAMRDLLRHTLGAPVAILVETEASLPPVLADREQLETVLVNLATNARDAMPNGGTLTLSAMLDVIQQNVGPHGAGRARPRRLQTGGYVRLSVADTGIGMTPEVLARVTEPFFTTKPEGRGTGLGLAMAKDFAEESGGALMIESTPKCGTTVRLWLPTAREPSAGAPAATETGTPTSGTPTYC